MLIDASKAFRFPSELIALANAVRHADDHDETRWIEWKSTLELGTQPATNHLAKQILGFANRDPDIAVNWAEGYAYLLIGVSPGEIKGVAKIDHQRLSQTLIQYIGGDIGWSPEYISIDGLDILTIVIHPPQPGDPIHFLRKDLPKRDGKGVQFPEGTIFIRHPGESIKANHDERQMLLRRARNSDANLDISVSCMDSVETAPNFHVRTEAWSERLVQQLLAARYDAETKNTSDIILGKPTPDRRLMSEYEAEVFDYVEKAYDLIWDRFCAELATHRPAGLRLTITNRTKRPFRGVQVVATLPNEALCYGSESKPDGPFELPAPPRPFGTPTWTHPINSFVSNIYSPLLRHIAIAPRWESESMTSGQRVTFDPIDLRPETSVDLPIVPLMVTEAAESKVSIGWTAAGVNVDGSQQGSITLGIVSSTYTPSPELDAAFEDGN